MTGTSTGCGAGDADWGSGLPCSASMQDCNVRPPDGIRSVAAVKGVPKC
jgi:hypothetical protein